MPKRRLTVYARFLVLQPSDQQATSALGKLSPAMNGFGHWQRLVSAVDGTS
jgi:hypothetical protein